MKIFQNINVKGTEVKKGSRRSRKHLHKTLVKSWDIIKKKRRKSQRKEKKKEIKTSSKNVQIHPTHGASTYTTMAGQRSTEGLENTGMTGEPVLENLEYIETTEENHEIVQL